MGLQDAVKRRVYATRDSLEGLPGLLKSYGIGEPFHLAFILNHLTKLGLGPKDTFDKRAFRNGFLGRLLRDSTHHVLRELKYHARIPVPGSYQLVGVADEGQGYIREGTDPKKVFTLEKGHIYGMFLRSSLARIWHSWSSAKFVCRKPLARNLYISRARV
jgi:RNA-dependent RNA polymerase